jgi:hypothetical protein
MVDFIPRRTVALTGVGSIAALDTDDAKRAIAKQLAAAFNAQPADIAETARLLLGGAFCRGVRHRQEQWNHAGEASWSWRYRNGRP